MPSKDRNDHGLEKALFHHLGRRFHAGLCTGGRGGRTRLPYNYDLADKMHYCQWFSVQAAWGAQARFKGAPAAFRYVDRERLRAWFMGDNAPPDAVYLLDELGSDDRPLYEDVALAGWKRMNDWLEASPEMHQPDWVLLPVPFYYICKEEN